MGGSVLNAQHGSVLSARQHPLPWRQLDVTLEQPISTQSEYSNRNGGHGGVIFEDFDEPFVPLDPNAPDPVRGDEFVGKTTRKMEFISITEGSIKIHRRETSAIRNNGIPLNQRESRHFSSRKGGSDGDKSSRQTQVAPEGDGKLETKNREDRAHYSSPIAALNSVINSLVSLSLDGHSILCVPAKGNCFVYREFLLEEIPINTDTSSRAWEWIASGKQRRCLLRAHVSRGGVHLYVYEIVRNPSEAFSTLVTFAPAGEELSDKILEDIMVAIHRKEGLPDEKYLEQKLGVRMERVRHPGSNQPDRQPLRLAIIKIFEELAAASCPL